jgi:hypothetical protein
MALSLDQTKSINAILAAAVRPSRGRAVTFKAVYRHYATARAAHWQAVVPIVDFLDPLIDFCMSAGVEILIDNGDVRLQNVALSSVDQTMREKQAA